MTDIIPTRPSQAHVFGNTALARQMRRRPLNGNFRSKCGGNIGMVACLIWVTWPARLLQEDTLPE